MSPVDARGRLEEQPFNYRAVRSGDVLVSWNGRIVTTLRGKAAERFLVKISDLDETAAQHLMARATGHFKHGNEPRKT